MPEPQPSRVQQRLGDFAPKMVSLTDDVLFGDIWERAELSPRDRSLITVAALIATGSTEQLPGHLRQSTGKRPNTDRAQGGHHPPRVLCRLATSDVRFHRRQSKSSRTDSRSHALRQTQSHERIPVRVREAHDLLVATGAHAAHRRRLAPIIAQALAERREEASTKAVTTTSCRHDDGASGRGGATLGRLATADADLPSLS